MSLKKVGIQYSMQLVVHLYSYFWPTLSLCNAQFSTVRRGIPSGHVVIKVKHRTARPRLSTETIQLKRNERLCSKLQPTTDPEIDEKSAYC